MRFRSQKILCDRYKNETIKPYNFAIGKKNSQIKYYPFKTYKVSKLKSKV